MLATRRGPDHARAAPRRSAQVGSGVAVLAESRARPLTTPRVEDRSEAPEAAWSERLDGDRRPCQRRRSSLFRRALSLPQQHRRERRVPVRASRGASRFSVDGFRSPSWACRHRTLRASRRGRRPQRQTPDRTHRAVASVTSRLRKSAASVQPEEGGTRSAAPPGARRSGAGRWSSRRSRRRLGRPGAAARIVREQHDSTKQVPPATPASSGRSRSRPTQSLLGARRRPSLASPRARRTVRRTARRRRGATLVHPPCHAHAAHERPLLVQRRPAADAGGERRDVAPGRARSTAIAWLSRRGAERRCAPDPPGYTEHMAEIGTMRVKSGTRGDAQGRRHHGRRHRRAGADR